MFGIDPALIVAGVILLALVVYAVTGGADFGGGVWDLLARGPRARKQRDVIIHAIGPVWEANHVWMIVVVVLMFVAFPKGFAAVMTALHIPIAIMLIGITLRGSAFVFRSYGRDSDVDWRRWSRVFAWSSTITPVFLGVVIGAVTRGSITFDDEGRVQTDFVSDWLAAFPFAVGFMVLALFAFLAATYLTNETEDAEVQDDFRARAIAASVAFGVTAAVAGVLSRTEAPHLWHVLAGNPVAIAMQVVTAVVAAAAIGALWTRRFGVARMLAMAQAVLVILAWGVSQDGHILVGALTIEDAAAPDAVLKPVIVALGLGMMVLIPSFAYLYRVFKTSDARLPAE